MKYLLKFKIKTWGGYVGHDKEYNLTLKVEFIDEMVKRDGFFQLGLTSRWNVKARWIFYLKSCEVVEGPEEVRNPNNNDLKFLLWRNDCQDYVVIALQVHNGCAGVNFMGFEPIPDDGPQTISSSPQKGE